MNQIKNELKNISVDAQKIAEATVAVVFFHQARNLIILCIFLRSYFSCHHIIKLNGDNDFRMLNVDQTCNE